MFPFFSVHVTGSSQQQQPDWYRRPPFTATPGVVPDMTGKSPIDYFTLYFNENVREHIHRETTRYAKQYMAMNATFLQEHPQARAHDWVRHPMTLKEVDVVIALLIAMGLVGYPTLRLV